MVQITKAMRNPVRQRAATTLLAQSLGAQKNFEAALTHASSALELTKKLKFERLIPVDLYNVGLFKLMLGQEQEAVAMFKEARKTSNPTEAGFQKELLFNMGQALIRIGEKGEAEEVLRAAVGPCAAAKDWRKVVAATKALATFEEERGSNDAAKSLLEKALEAATAGNLKDERKGIRRRIEAL